MECEPKQEGFKERYMAWVKKTKSEEVYQKVLTLVNNGTQPHVALNTVLSAMYGHPLKGEMAFNSD